MIDLESIKQFYETETGLNARQGKNRILKIQAFLSETGLGLDEIQTSKTQDYLWASRDNRTEYEKRSRRIGSTTKGHYETTYYFVHKKNGLGL